MGSSSVGEGGEPSNDNNDNNGSAVNNITIETKGATLAPQPHQVSPSENSLVNKGVLLLDAEDAGSGAPRKATLLPPRGGVRSSSASNVMSNSNSSTNKKGSNGNNSSAATVGNGSSSNSASKTTRTNPPRLVISSNHSNTSSVRTSMTKPESVEGTTSSHDTPKVPVPADNTASNGSVSNTHSMLPPPPPPSTTPSSSPRLPKRPTSTSAPLEQGLFEHCLCQDPYGVAVLKINHNGKANLRSVRCVYIDEPWNAGNKSVSSRSASSGGGWGRKREPQIIINTSGTPESTSRRALIWGKKKDVAIPVDQFVAVYKGKYTERTRRNSSPSTCVLSLVTKLNDPACVSLDIETPKRIDCDKFARAFGKFLNVPVHNIGPGYTVMPALNLDSAPYSDSHSLHSTDNTTSCKSLQTHVSRSGIGNKSDSFRSVASEGQQRRVNTSTIVKVVNNSGQGNAAGDSRPRSNSVEKPVASTSDQPSGLRTPQASISGTGSYNKPPVPSEATHGTTPTSSNSNTNQNSRQQIQVQQMPPSVDQQSGSPKVLHTGKAINVARPTATTFSLPTKNSSSDAAKDDTIDVVKSDDSSAVSSLTGHAYDQELVEELHHALTELRSELEESRAEAARAVKVAEQAIQSAERSNSIEWQNTVTHKAAEAAAQAQKRSAEAMAKARNAEKLYTSERRTAQFWRKQAEVSEEEAGILQTRAAAAEVQRAAMSQQVQHLRETMQEQINSLQARFQSSELQKEQALEVALECNRALRVELDVARKDLSTAKNDLENEENRNHQHESISPRMLSRSLLGLGVSRRKRTVDNDNKRLLSGSSSSNVTPAVSTANQETAPVLNDSIEQLVRLQSESSRIKQQFEMLRLATADELGSLPQKAKSLTGPLSDALCASQGQVMRLRDQLALEAASRRKLLHEVQDLRGHVRVYCRPCPLKVSLGGTNGGVQESLVSLASQDTLVVHRNRAPSSAVGSMVSQSDISGLAPISFECDHVFRPDAAQSSLYTEFESVCLDVLDGYKICFMAYGASGSGKTLTLLGDCDVQHESDKEPVVTITNHGIQLHALKQLFTVSKERSERYKDSFVMTIVEVHHDRLCDLISGTNIGRERGVVVVDDTSSKTKKKDASRSGSTIVSADTGTEKDMTTNKLEIRSDVHGETIVRGLLAVELRNFDDALCLWQECLQVRSSRLMDQGIDVDSYDHQCNIIATLKVTSTNITTGVGSVGKLQFADLAAADLAPKTMSGGADAESTNQPSSVPTSNDTLTNGIGLGEVALSIPTTSLSHDASSKESIQQYEFKYKSIECLGEVVSARSQFTRSIPYRNSTLTHVLRDALECDTKVSVIACISSQPRDLRETLATLRFASRIRRVNVGKATKHVITPP